MTDFALDVRLVDWASETIGAPIERWEPHPASGRSRLIWVLHPGGTSPARPLLLRSETGLGPFAGTEFTLAREASVLRVLADTDIPVPSVRGVTPDGCTVLMELLPGSADLDLSGVPGLRVLTEYCRILARLHRLNVTEIELPQPQHPSDHALLDLAAHQRSYRACAPQAVADDALSWLAEHAVGYSGRGAVLHGDAGPGNFLHEGGKVTGLIDWEMAHLGDPMDDLAWLWFRIGVLRTAGGTAHTALHEAYRAYSDASGFVIEPERINYYAMAVLTRCLIATLVRNHNNPDDTSEPVDRMSGLVRLALENQHHLGRISGASLPPIPA